MDASFAEQPTLDCPDCKNTISPDVWLIVDGVERPDLLDLAREGTLHALRCPHCESDVGSMDAPLLLLRRNADPALLFSPAQQTSVEQDREHAIGLVGAFAGGLGDEWRDGWVADGLASAPRAALPAVLAGADPEEALRKMAEQAREALERLREEEPDTFRELEEAAQQVTEQNPLLEALQAFTDARTWTDSRRVVQANPDLLSDEVDELLGQIIEAAREQGNESAVAHFEEHRALLRRCREIGTAAAFAEKMAPTRQPYRRWTPPSSCRPSIVPSWPSPPRRTRPLRGASLTSRDTCSAHTRQYSCSTICYIRWTILR